MPSVSAASHTTRVVPPPVRIPGMEPRVVHCHPDDLLPTWKLTLQKIAELVIHILVAIGFILIAHASLPISIRPVVLPLIAFGVVFATAFMFIPNQITPENDSTVPQVKLSQVLPPIAAVNAPRGLKNGGNNCWINSLEQVLRKDRDLMKMFRGLPALLKNFPEAAVALPLEILFSPRELAAHPILGPVMPASSAHLPLYKPTLELISQLDQISTALGDRKTLNIAQWLNLAEEPLVPDEWFNHQPIIDKKITRDAVISQIAAIKKDRESLEFFKECVLFLQELPLPTPENTVERNEILRYLTSIHSTSKPRKSLDFFRAQADFLSNYERGKPANSNSVATSADSQTLRLAFHALNSDLKAVRSQEDPAVGLAVIENLLFPELKVSEKITRTFQTKGDDLPALAEGVSPISEAKENSRAPFINLEIKDRNPNLSDLWRDFRDQHVPSLEENPNYEFKLQSVKGLYVYPLASEKYELKTGPSSLWICLKRFHSKFRKSSVHQNPLSRPDAVSWKLDTPVILPDILDVQTIDEGKVQYKLDGFIVHFGQNVHSGHYKSYTLEHTAAGEEVWYETNDARVREVEGDELERLKMEAYIPHYSRIEP